MQLAPRIRLMNWLVAQGLTGLPEHELVRGFCERCCAEGIALSYGIVVIDTLHPIFEGRGFRWHDVATNQPETFEYGPAESDAADGWRRSIFYEMLQQGQEQRVIDLTDSDSYRYSRFEELAGKGHKHLTSFVHRFGEGGTMGQMDCVYSSWTTRADGGFGDEGLAALRDLVPALGLAIKSAAQADITIGISLPPVATVISSAPAPVYAPAPGPGGFGSSNDPCPLAGGAGVTPVYTPNGVIYARGAGGWTSNGPWSLTTCVAAPGAARVDGGKIVPVGLGAGWLEAGWLWSAGRQLPR